MKTSILKGFIALDKMPMFKNADGSLVKLVGPVCQVSGCQRLLRLTLRGIELNANVTPVRKGDGIEIMRGEGQRVYRESFGQDGVLLTVPVPREMAAGLRGRTIPLALTFRGGGALRKLGNGTEYELLTSPQITGARLAKSEKDADCLLSLID